MKGLLLLLFSLYMLIVGYLYFAQQSFIYFPQYTRPASIPTNFELKHDGLLLKGWVQNEEADDAIIYFGGNGEGIEHNLPQFRNLFADKAVYMLSYRGYGNSEGEPSEAGIYSDALALYDKVSAKHGSISIIGRSLGSAVATYVAVHRATDRLVLITPFASLGKLARQRLPLFPVELLLKDKYASAARAGEIKARTLIIYAGNDKVVPEDSTKELITGFAGDQIKVKKINGAGHNSISEYAEYENGLQGFLVKMN